MQSDETVIVSLALGVLRVLSRIPVHTGTPGPRAAAALCGSSVRQHSERAEPDPASPPQPASRRPGAIGRGGGGGGGGGGGRACADGVCGDGAGLAARSLIPPGFHTECAPYGIHRVKKQNGERV